MAERMKKQTSLQKFMGRMQDHLSAGKVIASTVDSRSSQIKLAILKATGHEDEMVDDGAVRAVITLGSASRMRASLCVDGILKRLHKTHSWIVALKCLIVLNSCLGEGGFMFQDQISFLLQKGKGEDKSRRSGEELGSNFCVKEEGEVSGSGHSHFYSGNKDENHYISDGNGDASQGSSGNNGNHGNNGRIYGIYNGSNDANTGSYNGSIYANTGSHNGSIYANTGSHNGRNDENHRNGAIYGSHSETKGAGHGNSSAKQEETNGISHSKLIDLSDFFDPNFPYVSTWIKWYARFIQQWIQTSRALGVFFDSSMTDVTCVSDKILHLPNPQLLKGISTLNDLLQEASHAEELVFNHCLVSQSLQLAVTTASKAYELIKLCLVEFCSRPDAITQAQASAVLKICETISAKSMLFLHLFQLCQSLRNDLESRRIVFHDYKLLQLQEDLKRVIEGNTS